MNTTNLMEWEYNWRVGLLIQVGLTLINSKLTRFKINLGLGLFSSMELVGLIMTNPNSRDVFIRVNTD